MPTVRKTSSGRVTIHGAGIFTEGDTREVDAETAAYLVEDRGDFKYDGDAHPAASVNESGGTDVEYNEPDSDGSEAPLGANAGDLIDDGVCPWCSDYEGDHVGQHASSAHADEWAAYQEGN